METENEAASENAVTELLDVVRGLRGDIRGSSFNRISINMDLRAAVVAFAAGVMVLSLAMMAAAMAMWRVDQNEHARYQQQLNELRDDVDLNRVYIDKLMGEGQ